MRRVGWTQEVRAERMGLSPVAIAQRVRLHGLPETAIKAIESGAITAGHGVALLGIPAVSEQLMGLGRVIREHWNVRQTEAWIRSRATEMGTRTLRDRSASDPESRALESEVRQALGT